MTRPMKRELEVGTHDSIDERLRALGIELPTPPPPAGSYSPVVIRDGTGFVSAQVPLRNGAMAYAGRVGEELTLKEAMAAAELAALNVLAQIERATDGWRSFAGLLRVEGHVASARGFLNQPEVLDAASRLFMDALGARGEHARSAFSAAQLPLDAAVELVVTFASR